MPDGFRWNKAQILGRGHALAGINCQDALSTGSLQINGDTVYYGVICDGCSEGKSSEVGAKLAAVYIGRQIEILVASKTPLFKIPQILHKRILDFLGNLLDKMSFETPETRVEFIKNNLLFTVVAFVFSKDQLMIFAQGDGVIIVNDVAQIRDENDTPWYIGYGLVDRKFLTQEASPLPVGFDVQFFDTQVVDHFAIASDSLGQELFAIPQIWNNEKAMSLQRRVNAWSWNDHMFKDDLTVIVVEKIPEGG